MEQYLGEFFGTMVLIIIGTGVCASINLKDSLGRGAGWLYINIGWGMAVTFGVYTAAAFGAPGHLNPAITLAFAAFGNFSWNSVFGYLIAQLLGAFVGAGIVAIHFYPHFKNAKEGKKDGNVVGIFATGSATETSRFMNFLSEFIATAVFVFVLLKLGDFSQGLKPLIVGLLIMTIGNALGSTTGYALNPARDLMPRLAYSILPIPNKTDSNWGYAWVPIAGPIAGALLACAINLIH
ncbi:MAG: aquaporin family protein [Streptococcaceae bacterium]|jgi:glycerol uptake facilitator protein|nr:aquaporin family protein [Streptococcaceae bacterium]